MPIQTAFSVLIILQEGRLSLPKKSLKVMEVNSSSSLIKGISSASGSRTILKPPFFSQTSSSAG
jgi:hypothetical protein